MAKTTKYFMQNGVNLLDFSLDYADLNQAGQSILVKGTGGKDTVFLSGSGYNFTYQQSDGGDRIYVNALSTDFIATTPTSTTLNLTRTVNSVTTNITLPSGVSVIFNDGAVMTSSWISNTKAPDGTRLLPTLDTSLKSDTAVDSISQANLSAGQSYSSKIKAFASGNGATFSSIQSGMKLTPKGTSSVDYVYVRQGTEVDCTKLGDGVDQIYLTGYWADYSKVITNSGGVKLTSNQNAGEIVTVSADDRIIFADGTVLTQAIINALRQNSQPTIADLATNWDVNTVTPGLSPAIPSIVAVTDNEGSITGTVAQGGVTDDTHLNLRGTLNKSIGLTDHVVIYDGNTELGNALVTGKSWSYTDTRTLSDSQVVSYTAAVVNALNLAGTSSEAYSVTIDTQAPDSVSILSSRFSSLINNQTQIATGQGSTLALNSSAPNNESLTLTLSSALGSQETLQGSVDNLDNGVWHDFTVTGTTAVLSGGSQDLVNGSSALHLRIVDTAGNSTVLSDVMLSNLSTPPVFANVTYVNENSPTSTVVYTSTAQILGAGNVASVSYRLSGNDASAFNTNTSNGELTFKTSPDYEAKSSYNLDIIAVDSAGNSSSQGITIKINNLNEAGNIANINGSPATGQTLRAGTITDPNNHISGTAYQWQRLTNASSNTWTDINGATSSSYVLTSSDSGYQYRVKATYTDGQASSQSVTSNATPHVINLVLSNFIDSGISAADRITNDIDYTLSLGAYSDGTSSSATISYQENVSGIWTNLASPALVNQAEGTHLYRANVTENAISNASNLIAVVIDRSAPSFVSDTSASVDENIDISTPVYTAFAVDNNVVSYYGISGTDRSAFNIDTSSGIVTFKSSPNFETKSSYQFNVIAADSAGNSISQGVTLGINNINEPSTLVQGVTGNGIKGFTRGQVGSFAIAADFSDLENDTLTYQLLSNNMPAGLSLNTTTGIISGTPTVGTNTLITIGASDGVDNGTDASRVYDLRFVNNPEILSISVSDSDTGVASKIGRGGKTVTAVLTLNENISASSGAVDTSTVMPTLVAGGTTLAISNVSLGTGTNANKLTVTATLPSNANTDTVTLTGLNLSNITLTGADTLGTMATSSGSLALSDSYTIDNTRPIFSSANTASVFENNSIGMAIYTAVASDAHNVSYQLGGNDSGYMNIDSSTGIVTMITRLDYEAFANVTVNSVVAGKPVSTIVKHPELAKLSFNVIAVDDAGNRTPQAITLQINDVNEAPKLSSNPTSYSAREVGQSYTLDYTKDFIDPEGDPLTYQVLGGHLPIGMSLNTSTGLITGAIQGNETTFTLGVNDGVNPVVASQPYTIMTYVTDRTPPVLSATTSGTSHSGVKLVTLDTPLTANETVKWSLAPGGDGLLFDIDVNTGALSFKTEPRLANTYQVRVIAADLSGNTTNKDLTVSVVDYNSPTTYANSPRTHLNILLPYGQATTSNNTVLNTFFVWAVDPENAPITYVLSGNLPAGMSLDTSTGYITGTATNPNETSHAIVTASDGIDNGPDAQIDYDFIVTNPLQILSMNVKDSVGNAYAGKAGDTVKITLTTSEPFNGSYLLMVPPTLSIAGQQLTVTNVAGSRNYLGNHYNNGYSANGYNLLIISATLPAGVEGTGISLDSLNLVDKVSGLPIHLDGVDTLSTMSGVYTYTNFVDDSYVIDNTAPTFASNSATITADENIATSTTIFTPSASTDDNHALSYSLSTGDSGSLFNIDTATGAVTFKSSPNYENLSVYNFAVIASDWAGNKATENIRLNINNLDEVGTFAAITGNATSGGVITAGTLTDQDGIIAGSISYDWQYLDNGIWRSYNPAHSNASETLSAVEFSANANPHQVRVVANYSDLFGQHTLISTLTL